MQVKIQQNDALFGRASSYRLAFWAALLIYLVLQSQRLGDLFGYLKLPDNDDEMRLVSVIDFMAGQGWYDTVQHRAMPPGGLSLHWSRLIDLPLAGLAAFFGLFTTPDMALALTAAVWPGLMFVVFLAITGRVAARAFGYTAASFAVIAAAAMATLSRSYFPVGRVDHHNVQLICVLLVISALVLPGQPVRRGAIAGLAAAVSLAVGLEMIVVLALAGVVMTVQHVLDQPGGTDRLMGYGTALGGAAPLLFLVQTDPAYWAMPRCDQLSQPVLAITSAGMAFAVITYLSRDTVVTVRARALMALAMGGVIVAALWPVLAPCREGPFSVLPPELRDLILSRITESLPAAGLFAKDPAFATQLLVPQILVALLLTWQLARTRKGDRAPVAVLLVFTLLGLAGLFYQVRAVIWGLAALPLAFGVALAWAVGADWGGLRRSRPVVLTLAAVLVLYPHLFTQSPVFAAALRGDEQTLSKLSRADQTCARRDALAGLNGIAPAGILAPLNLGTKILLHTPHSIFAAPYHRAPEAYWNGTQAFMGSDTDMAKRLRITKADYVLVCDGETYGDADSIGSRLARGETPSWLDAVDLNGGPARLFRIRRDEVRRLLNGG